MKIGLIPPSTVVSLGEIDGVDRTYSIRPAWVQNTALRESVERVGVLSPLHLEKTGDGHRVVSGFSRFDAACGAGLEVIPAIVWCDITPIDLFQLQLEENLAAGPLSDLEKALAVGALRDRFSVSEEDIVGNYLAPLGVRPDGYQLQLNLRIARLPDDLQRAIPGMSFESCLRIAHWDRQERHHVLEVIRRFRWGRSKEREVVALLADFRDGSRTDPPLYPPIRELLAPQLTSDACDRRSGDDLLNWLRARRYPQLEAHRDRFKVLTKKLGLSDLQLMPPRNFEGDRYTIQLSVRSTTELKQSVVKLGLALEQPEMQELFDLL